MAAFRSDFRISDDTELIKLSDDRHKFVMRHFKKVQAKMYDAKCDIKLQVGKDTFRAHKEVLSEASDYFSAMFSHNMKEKEQDAIEIKGISAAGFTPMMEYFYHGHITVDPNNIEDILEAARFFHIEWMIKICCDFLIRHLCIENYDNVLNLADKFYLGDLRYDIFKFVGQNFVMLAKRPKFMLLSYELFQMILDNDYFIDSPEYYIFQTVLKWLQHDSEEREQYRVEMLTLIRYPLFAPEELEAVPSDLDQIEEVKTLLDEARAYHANPAAQCIMASENSRPRGGRDVLFTFQAIEDASVLQYKIPGLHDVFTQEMDSTFMDSVFEFSASAVLGNFLFIVGGYNRNNWSSAKDMYRYDPRNMSWLQLTPMHCPRVSFVLCASDQGLYAITGIDHVVEDLHDREDILDSVEFYNPQTNSWRAAPTLPYGCFSASGAWAAGHLFVTGGISANYEDTIPVNYLHTHTPGNGWSRKSPMLCERHSHCMLPFDSKIFVFGGFTCIPDSVSFETCLRNEVYDIETNQWSEITPTPTDIGKLHSCGAVLNSNIFVLGGKGEDRFLLEFDLDSMDFGLGEFCGQHSQKLGVLRVALPDQESEYTLDEAQEGVTECD